VNSGNDDDFCAEIQSGGRPTILQGDCIQRNISVCGINISLRVIELLKKKGLYKAVFEAVEGNILCLFLILRPAFNPTVRLHP
jgi:hypothetical protein